MNFTFWAAEVKTNGTTAVKVGNAEDALHLSMACFGENVQDNSRTVLFCECNGRKAPIAVLLQGSNENQKLDLIISGNAVCNFSVGGFNQSPVYLSGFIQPLIDAEDLGQMLSPEAMNEEVDPPSSVQIPVSPGAKRPLSTENQDEPPKKKLKEDTPEPEVMEEEPPAQIEIVSQPPAQPVSQPPVSPKPVAAEAEVTSPPSAKKGKKKKKKKMTYTESGLGIRVVKKGNGPAAAENDTIRIRYIGQLKDKSIFDKNLTDGLTFKIGAGSVVKGMDEGVRGMQPEEKRKIVIPANLAYGSEGDDKIPPNSELTFTLECVEILKA